MTSSSRIPASLQAVFLAGNRGKEVNVVPPNSQANKVFLRNWIFQNRSGGNSSKSSKSHGSRRGSTRSLFGDSQEKIKCLAQPELTTATSVKNTARNVGEKTKRTMSSSPSSAASSIVKPTTSISSASSPQEFLDQMLRQRGYSTDTYNTLMTALYNKPTSHQMASYGVKMSEITKHGNVAALQSMLRGGLSANPCNAYGESILHLVCRRGNVQLLHVLEENGCNFEICDDYGRTALHDTCWSPSPAFECVELLLQHVDARMFYMMDRRGSLPLSYVHKDHYPMWIAFLDKIKDTYFPIRNTQEPQGPPLVAKTGPNSRPLPSPKHALPDHLCTMVANGRLTIGEAQVMAKHEEEELLAAEKEREQDAATVDMSGDDYDSSDDDSSDSDDEDDDSDYSSSDCDSSSYDEDQLEADVLFDVFQMTRAYVSQSRSAR